MVLCAAVYDPQHGPDGGDTHNCDQADKHEGAHHCDICGTWWTARVGVPSTQEAMDAHARTVRRQVAMARQDAHLGNVGWVRITETEDGSYEYERVAPDRVVVKVTLDELGGDDDDDVVIP